VTAGSYESIYANMPRWGLAAAGEQVEAVGRMKDARSRVGAAGLEK
jgi:hypothetical protein